MIKPIRSRLIYNLYILDVAILTTWVRGVAQVCCILLGPIVINLQKGGHYWFDIREVNVDKIQGENAYILIRIIPDMFILIKLENFSFLLSEDTKRYRKNSGAVWGFYTSINTTEKRAKIVSSADSSLSHGVQILDLEEIVIALTHLV